MALEFIGAEGTRGRKASVRGYLYTIQVRATPTVRARWQCIKRECKAALRISEGERDFEEIGEHTHVPDWGDFKAKKERQRLLEEARRQRHTAPAVMTQRAFGRVDSETLMKMPKEKALKKAIQRVRREEHPELPKTIEDLENIPDRYSIINGGRWLQHDSREGDEPDGPRIILFATQSGLQQLSRSLMWYADGTFKTVPRIAAQLYTVHYEKMGNVLPACYAIMQDRTQDTYIRLFTLIRELLPAGRQNGPSFISMDFELGAMNAFKQCFPNSQEAFCFFHFSQSIWRKAQESGIAASYVGEGSTELRRDFHSCLSLAFVPPDHVTRSFQKLRDHAVEELDPVIDLLEDTYVLGRRRGRGRRPPRYPIQTWNVHGRTLQGIARTNNSVEGWNRRFGTLLGKHHPNIFEFLEALMEEEKYSESQRILIEAGEQPQQKKKSYIENDRRLMTVSSQFNDYLLEEDEREDEEDPWEWGLLKFLKTIGHSARGPWQEA